MPALGRREIDSQNVGGSKVQSQDQNLIHRICNRGQAGRNRVYDSRQTNRRRLQEELDKVAQTSGLGPGSGIICGPGAAEKVSMERGGSDLPSN